MRFVCNLRETGRAATAWIYIEPLLSPGSQTQLHAGQCERGEMWIRQGQTFVSVNFGAVSPKWARAFDVRVSIVAVAACSLASLQGQRGRMWRPSVRKALSSSLREHTLHISSYGAENRSPTHSRVFLAQRLQRSRKSTTINRAVK